jgi:hypothetical protein
VTDKREDFCGVIAIETDLYTRSEFSHMVHRRMRLTMADDDTGSSDAKQALDQAARPLSSSM